MKAFRYERLEIYRLAQQFGGLVFRVITALPAKRGGTRMGLEKHLPQTSITIVRATTALTRGDAIWELRVARRATFDCIRYLRWLRDCPEGRTADALAATELGERLIALLTDTMVRLKAGGGFEAR